MYTSDQATLLYGLVPICCGVLTQPIPIELAECWGQMLLSIWIVRKEDAWSEISGQESRPCCYQQQLDNVTQWVYRQQYSMILLWVL